MTQSIPARRIRGVTETAERFAPELRKDLTPQERVLWSALRNRQLDGVKFRRQHAVGGFVLDFYAPELKLVVELDGDIHDTPERRRRDQMRDRQLAHYGYTVVRVTNQDAVVNLPAVLARLSQVIERLRAARALTPGPSPV